MIQLDQYFLGNRHAEQRRLQSQAQMLAQEAECLFDQIGNLEGTRVVEIGCGPRGTLDILSERVGPAGSVTGIERNEDAVRLARDFVKERNLPNVEVIHADGRATGLETGAFDLATARLVLVNVPHPEQIVAEMVALVRQGGIVALYEADWLGVLCDPPHPAWETLVALLSSYSTMNEIDLFVGRKIPRMLREAGLADVRTIPLIHQAPIGHEHRTLLLDFAENLRERLVGLGMIGESEFNELLRALRRHIGDPNTLVLPGIFTQTWGRRPYVAAQGASIGPLDVLPVVKSERHVYVTPKERRAS